MRSIFLCFWLFAALGFLSFRYQRAGAPPATPDARVIINRMLAEADAMHTLSFDLKITERSGGKIRNSASFVKIQRKPRMVYMKLNGPELLYAAGQNGNKVLVNPGGFPFVNLSLDANSSTLHKDQHHTVNEVGFDYITDILRDAMTRSGDKFDTYFKYVEELQWNGIACYKVKVTDENYKFMTYVVKPSETLISIARKLRLSEYKILELNKLTDFGSIKEGKVLIVPSVYARLTELIIDKQSGLPLSTKVYDNEGLFEAYDYMNLKINPVFASNEFSKDFPGYGF
jgi:outer membrane lipoprotein-sorting protein